MLNGKYIKKIDTNSDEYKNINLADFDNDFYYEKTKGQKTYTYFFLTNDNRAKLSEIFSENSDLNKNFDDKNIEYYKLHDYQKDSLNHILKNRKVCLFLPVRFGKTYISITAILNNRANTILFVDKNMIGTFEQTFKDHNEENIYIYHDKKNKDIFDKINDDSNDYKIIITTEETFASRFSKQGIDRRVFEKFKLFKNIIIDEFHNFIKTSNKYYKKIQGIINKYFTNIDLFILLSATPMNHEILDIFKAIKLLDKEFTEMHWKEKWGIKFIQLKYGGENKINCPDVIRKVLDEFLYRPDNCHKYNSLNYLYIDEIEIEEHPNIQNRIGQKSNFIEKQKLSDDHRIANDTINNKSPLPKKIEKAIELINKNKDKKIVVFCYFKEAQTNIIDDFKQNNINAKHINADVNSKERQKIINEFQNENLNVIVLQKDTAIGITLDKADLGIYICDEYSPEKLYQAAGRISTTNFNNPTPKLIYLVTNKKFNSKGALLEKYEKLAKFNIDYGIRKLTEVQCHIFVESNNDKNLIKRIIDSSNEDELIAKTGFKFDSDFLNNLKRIHTQTNKFHFLVICDNDQIISDLKLDENKINYLTYNQLFNLEDTHCKTIEDVLFHLNEYNQNQMNLIHNCSYSKNKNYKNLIDAIKDKTFNNLKEEISIFINEFIDDYILIDTIYDSIIENKIQGSNADHIKLIVKTYFMQNISEEFIKKYRDIVIDTIKKKKLNSI